MKRFDSINVIPLIDVMLVLLAIVLTTASFIVKDSLNIQLPETESTQSYTPPETPPVKFDIDAQNRLYRDETLMTVDELPAYLKQLDAEQAIIIQVDQTAEFGGFVQLVDQLKLHRLSNLTILTQSK